MNIVSAMTRAISLAMVITMIVSTLTISWAEAGMITTEQVLATQRLSNERSRIISLITRADVRQQMQALGVDPSEAEARVAALSDDEVRRIAGRLDQLPAGQGALETAIVATLFAFVILLVTDILGYTDIFPFVKETSQQ